MPTRARKRLFRNSRRFWRPIPDMRPARSAFPSANCVRVVHADRVLGIDNSPAALGHLPFQRIAGQVFAGRTWPYKTPKILLPLGPLPLLDPRGHSLELVPAPRRRPVSIFLKKVGTIKQDSYIGVIRDS